MTAPRPEGGAPAIVSHRGMTQERLTEMKGARNMTKLETARPRTGLKRAMKAGALSAGLMLLAAGAACSSPEQRVERYTQSGLAFLEEGDLGRANVQFQNALKIDEEHIPALLGLVDLAEERQDFRAMFGVLQRIVRLEPENVEAQLKLGKLYLIGSDEQAALESADTALELAPESPDAMAFKAAVLMKLEDAAGAVDLAKKALELDPNNVEAVTVIITDHVRSRDNQAALAEIDAALERDQNVAVLHLLRLQILMNMGRTDELLAGYDALIQRFPEEAAYRKLYVRELVNRQMFAEAKTQLEEIVRLSPGEIEPVLDVVRLDYRLNGADSATNTFESYVEAAPDNTDLTFRYASFLRQEGDHEAAEAIYNTLARSNEEALVLRARNEIAALRLVQGQRDEAQKIVNEILAKDSMNTEALLKRAGLKIDNADYDGAIADLRTALNNSPESVPAKMLMATAFERKGDIDFARAQLVQAVAESGNAAGPTNLYAQFLIRRGEPARAEQALNDSLAKAPGNLDSLKLLASVQLMRQDWRGAQETAKVIESVREDDSAVGRILGAASAGLGDHAGAIDALAEVNARSPLDARPLAVLVRSYLSAERGDEAVDLLESMIEADKDNYDARMLLARAHETQGDRRRMEETLKAAVAATPTRAEAREALYRYYVASQRRDEARQVIEEGLAAAPDNDGLKMLQADLMIASDRKEEAIAVYEDVLRRRPNDQLAANNYASLVNELREDETSRARALEYAATLKDSQNPYFLDTYGWALYLNGDYEGAVAALEKAAEGAPAMDEIAYHLGAAYLAAGDEAKARETLEPLAAGDGDYAERARARLADGN